jgi:hypothetical protein
VLQWLSSGRFRPSCALDGSGAKPAVSGWLVAALAVTLVALVADLVIDLADAHFDDPGLAKVMAVTCVVAQFALLIAAIVSYLYPIECV